MLKLIKNWFKGTDKASAKDGKTAETAAAKTPAGSAAGKQPVVPKPLPSEGSPESLLLFMQDVGAAQRGAAFEIAVKTQTDADALRTWLIDVTSAFKARDRRMVQRARELSGVLAKSVLLNQEAQVLCLEAEALFNAPVLALNKLADLDKSWEIIARQVLQTREIIAVSIGLTDATRVRFASIRERIEVRLASERQNHERQRQQAEQQAREQERARAEAAQQAKAAPVTAIPAAMPATLAAQKAVESVADSANEVSPSTEPTTPGSVVELAEPAPALTVVAGLSRFSVQISEQLGQTWHEQVQQIQTQLDAGQIRDAQQAEGRLKKSVDAEIQRQLLQAGTAGLSVPNAPDWLSVLPRQTKRQLQELRSELGRLKGWQSFAGQGKRDELVAEAERIASLPIPPDDLAHIVAELRQQWKALDKTGAPAGDALWLRFDSACNAAYARAKEHFDEQGKLRAAALALRIGLIEQIEAYAQGLQGQPAVPASTDSAATSASGFDFKQLSQFVNDSRKRWQALSDTDEKAELRIPRRDFQPVWERYQTALRGLTNQLDNARQHEIAAREKLIRAVTDIIPGREAASKVQEMQNQWQQCARALPLQRADEERLWLAFRAACDGVFAARREQAQAADAERQRHQQQAEAVLASLQTLAQAADGDSIRQQQAALSQQWDALGQLPRASEASLLQQYRLAQQAVRDQQHHLLQQERSSIIAELLSSLQSGESDVVLPAKQVWLHAVLDLEIEAAVDSPAQWSAERMQRQILRLASKHRQGLNGPSDDVWQRWQALVTRARDEQLPISADDVARLRELGMQL
ncbi:DUF349 domain-containing protein [Ampullimonas aquatilis]|uniref:DUF349 domain-containing protein n=1 Tax=Ampullimonas aquatilis TaxID=1341549 RepID=UPI003C761937